MQIIIPIQHNLNIQLYYKKNLFLTSALNCRLENKNKANTVIRAYSMAAHDGHFTFIKGKRLMMNGTTDRKTAAVI